MKIGTITFWHSKENYGAILQCYALLKFLNQNGYNAKLIKTRIQPWGDLKHRWFYKFTNILTLLFHPYQLMKLITKIKSNTKAVSGDVVDRSFSDFIDSKIPSFPGEYTFDDLNSKFIDLDAIIVGSDQVWGGFSNLYFLNFKGDFKRISYAASFGGAKFENPFMRRKISSWLNKFDLVTVRETEGVEFCSRVGVNATMVPDPTLLLTKEDYLTIIDKKEINNQKPYVFLYLLGKSISIEVAVIMEFAKKNGLEVIYVASQGREDDFEKVYPTVEEWLSYMRDAKYVITNSFHGSAFALLFEKPFLTFPLAGSDSKMNGRIETMLGKYHLEDRIYSGDLRALFNSFDNSHYKLVKAQETERVKSMLSEVL